MRQTSVSEMLHHALLATLASSAAGCGISTDGFEALACGDGQSAEVLSGFSPADPGDYLELRERDSFAEPSSANVTQAAGEPCAAATDVAACQAAIDAATSDGGFRLGQCVQVCSDHYLVVNRGDEVSVIDTADGVRALLGDVDTPEEAVAIAKLAGYELRCGDVERGGVRSTAAGYELIATVLTADCDPIETTRYRLRVHADGVVEELESEIYSSESGACIGRRPSGHCAQRATARSRVGAYLGSVAHLEEAAVHAFEELRRELAYHRAPAALLARAECARRDEVRHARLMRRLARRFGGDAPRARAVLRPPRSLEALAVDNAAEGCVRETFGALVGRWQGVRAADPHIAAAMRAVSADEVVHAQLSWDIDRWARSRLSAPARVRVDRARDEALAALQRDADAPVDPELVRVAGWPTRAAHGELVRHFRDRAVAPLVAGGRG